MRKLQLTIISLFFFSFSYGLNVTIIESQSFIPGHDMDTEWSSVLTGMGHTPTISPQTTLDNTSFFSSTDILIISSGVIYLPANRVNTILQFIQSGKPVYIQSEYLSTYSTNMAFASIINSLGGSFIWNNAFSGNLQPMNVIGTFSTTNNTVASLSYYWYSVSGAGDCNTFNFLEHGGEYHGFQYVSPSPAFGSIITTTDQDWVRSTTSIPLMENIITHLISPPPSNTTNLNLGNDTTLCQGDTLILDATTPNATYLWQDSTTNPTFNVTQQGSYWVQVTTNNCTTTDVINITYNPSPSINLGNDTTLCQGEILLLDATLPNATYLWQDNTTNPTFNVTQQGVYWVQVTNSCGSTTDSININYNPIPSVNLGNDTTLCQGDTLLLDATFPNATYLWQDNTTNPTFNVTQQGVYWVQLTVNNCSTTDTININYSPLPSVNLGNDTTLCQGETLLLDATFPNATYLWQDNTTNPTFSVTQQGTYWVQVTNSCGSTTDTININYNPIPSVNLGNDTTLCQGETLLLDATFPNATYLWQDNTTSPTFNVTQQGAYWVQLTVNNCSITDTININYGPLLSVNLGNDTTLCQGETLLLDATFPNATYLWQDNTTSPTFNVTQQGTYWVHVTVNNCSTTDTININYSPLPIVGLGNDTTLCQGETLLLDATFPNATYLWQDNTTNPTFNVTQQGTYWVQVTNSCGSKTDSININYNPLPSVNLGNDTTLCQGETLQLDATFPNATYLWQDNTTNPTLNVTQQGVYWVQVTVNNCSKMDTLILNDGDCEILLEIPNVFTPNNDGINDLFVPVTSKGIVSMNTVIYNRWGNKIYETNNLSINWDGHDVSDGTYFWVILYTDIKGIKNTLKGYVTILK